MATPPWAGEGAPVPAVRRDHVLGQGEGLPWVEEEWGVGCGASQHLYMSQMLPPWRVPNQNCSWDLSRVGHLLSSACSPVPPSPEPQITSPPYDTWNITGQDVIFSCEVFAYPMASIEWRKDGMEMLLPGDDPHISVQVRSVPRVLDMALW